MTPNSTSNNAQKLKQAIEKAKQNPDSPEAVELRRRMESGQFNYELKELGMKTFEQPRPPVNLSKLGISSISGQLTQEGIQPDMERLKQAQAEGQKSQAGGQVSGAVSDIGEDFVQMGQNIREGFKRRTETLGEDIARRRADGNMTLREQIGTGLGFASATLRTAFDALGEAGMFAVKSVMTPEQEAAVADTFQQGLAKTLEATEGTRGREAVERMVAAYNVWAEENPEDAANLRDVSGIMLSLAEASGLKIGSTAAREAADIATDAVTKAARATGDATQQVGRKLDEGLVTAARAAGERIDNYTNKRREVRIEAQKAKIDSAVEDILRAGDDPKAVEAGRRVLSDLDISDTPTYKELQTKTQERLSALGEKQNELLSQFDRRFTSSDLVKTTDVDGTIVEQNFVERALSQLIDYHTAIDDPVQATRYSQLSAKLQNEGLSIAELNQIAKDHGRNLTGFNASGELASGLNKQSYESTRRGVKETLRTKIEEVADKKTRQQSEALDKAMSDIYTIQPLIDKMTEMVARQRQRTFKPTVRETLQKNGLKIADVLTLGSVQRLAPRAMEGMRINESLNYLESEKLLRRRLDELQKINDIQDDTKYAEALVDYVQNIQLEVGGMTPGGRVEPGLTERVREGAIRQPAGITPEQGEALQQLAKRLNESSQDSVPEYLRNNKQAGFANFTKPIGKNTTPEDIAKLMDDETFDAIAVALEDLPAARTNPNFNRFLDDMKLSKAANGELEEFLKETTTEYERLNPTKGTFNQGATPSTNLLEEAKGKTLDAFMGKQKALYHGTNAKFDKFDASKVGSNTGELNTIGTFFAETTKDVNAFKKTLQEGFGRGETRDTKNWRVVERYLPPDAKVFDLNLSGRGVSFKQAEVLAKVVGSESGETLTGMRAKMYIDELIDEGAPGESIREVIFDNADEFKRVLNEEGYIGYTDVMGKGAKEFVIFDPEKDLVTKSQLEDIWKQANQ